MISVKLPFSSEDRSEYKALLRERFPSAAQEVVDAQINALIDSKTILTNAIYHLSFYYVIADKNIVAQLRQEKSRFWLYALESLYNSGIMFLCGLMDEDKKIGYKNIRTIERCYPMLKNTEIQLQPLPKHAEEIYERLKSLRDKRLAHYEYGKEIKPQYYDDPATLCNIIYDYLRANEHIIFNYEIDTGRLAQFIHRNMASICHDIGVSPLNKVELKKLVNYIDILGAEK